MEDRQAGIGARIQKLRQLHNLTQEEFAEMLDISGKHVSSVERGRSRLSLDKLVLACEYLDCTMDYLVLGKGPQDTETYIPDSVIETFTRSDEKEIALLQEYLLMYAKLHH